jgi:cytochrome b involved in lipid metabolism
MKKKILVIVATLVIIVGITVFISMTQKTNNTGSQNISKDVSKQITLTEVAAHKTSSSCWTVVNGNVYDVTSFIPNHPGGDAILQSCGIDATTLFTNIHGSTRPASILAGYQIGVLK